MGYTHYFSYAPQSEPFLAAWPRMRADAALVLDRVAAAGVRLCLDPFEGTLPAEYEVVAVNGSEEDEEDCEPLILAPRWPERRPLNGDGRLINFCKTGGHPYDLAVTAILLRCHRLLPDEFAIHSDGDWDDEWDRGGWSSELSLPSARALVAELFGDDVSDSPFDPDRALGRSGD